MHDLNKAVAKGKISGQLADEVRVFTRDQREALVIPTDEEEAWTRLVCEADAVWHKAKAANDWESFEPYVDRIVETCKRHAGYLDSTKDPYDVMLDQNERGLTSQDFDAFCDQVRATVVPLVHAIVEHGRQPNTSFLAARVPEPLQRQISFDLIELLGIDRADTTLASTEHPLLRGLRGGRRAHRLAYI